MSQYLYAIPSLFRASAPAWKESSASGDDVDQHLYRRHLDGDDAAFSELFNRHNHRLYVYCLKLVGDADTAEDITQELWERVIRLRLEGKDVHNPGGFFVRMARNLSLNHLRSRKRLSALDDLPESAGPIDVPTDRTDREELVFQALEQLPFDYREVLILHNYSGYSLEEIADLLGKSAEAIWKRASRAREKLRLLVMQMMEQQQKQMERLLNDSASNGGGHD
jgi:RNA polymerase sigma-70 factor (ECF subfamily)